MIILINIAMLTGVFYCGFKIGQELQNQRISDLVLQYIDEEIAKNLDRKIDYNEKKEMLNRIKKEVEKHETDIND